MPRGKDHKLATFKVPATSASAIALSLINRLILIVERLCGSVCSDWRFSILRPVVHEFLECLSLETSCPGVLRFSGVHCETIAACHVVQWRCACRLVRCGCYRTIGILQQRGSESESVRKCAAGQPNHRSST